MKLEELKKNTRVTNSILATARNRLANDDSQKVVSNPCSQNCTNTIGSLGFVHDRNVYTITDN